MAVAAPDAMSASASSMQTRPASSPSCMRTNTAGWARLAVGAGSEDRHAVGCPITRPPPLLRPIEVGRCPRWPKYFEGVWPHLALLPDFRLQGRSHGWRERVAPACSYCSVD